MNSYTVERKVTFFYTVDAESPKDAIAIVEDRGEGEASISSTDWKVRRITDKMIESQLQQGGH